MTININKDISLRSRKKENAPEIFRVIDSNREYLRRWLSWVDSIKSPRDIEIIIESSEEKCKEGGDLVLGIFEHERYIGNIGLHKIKKGGSALIGYWLSEKMQGKGIMSASVKALMDYAYSEYELEKIYIHCADKNAKSAAIPERLLFTFEGIIPNGISIHGELHDERIYSMRKEDFVS